MRGVNPPPPNLSENITESSKHMSTYVNNKLQNNHRTKQICILRNKLPPPIPFIEKLVVPLSALLRPSLLEYPKYGRFKMQWRANLPDV